MLEAILLNKIVDVNNVAYDYDVTNEFTWNYRELVEIKKRQRKVVRYVRPTPKNILKIASAQAWIKAKKANAIKDRKQIVKNYVIYKFNEDQYNEDPGNELPGERGEILPGDPLYKQPITPESIQK